MSFEKKYFLIILLMLFLVPFSVKGARETVMNSSVASKENIFISLITDKTSYCEPEVADVTTTLENRGNLGTSGNLTTRIFDLSYSEIQSDVWQDTVLNAGETKNFTTNYSVQSNDSAGLYTVESNFSYNNEFKYYEKQFRIKSGIGTLSASPSNIEKTMMPGDSTNETVYLWLLYPCYGTNVSLNKSSGLPGDWISFSSNSTYVFETAVGVDVMIEIPRNASRGNYSGYIYAQAEDQQLSITVTIHVNTSGVFDVDLSIPSAKKEVCQGEDIYSTVTITKTSPNGTVNVNMTYQITDFNGTIIDKYNETVSVETSIQRMPTLDIPSGAEPGYYTFTAILEYKESLVYASDIFSVKTCLPPPPPPPSAGVGIVLPVVVSALSLNVSTHRLTTIVGNQTGFIAYVTNVGTEKIDLVRLEIEGIPSHWVTISPLKTDIHPNKTQNYIVIINVPESAEEGAYYLYVTAKDEVESNTELIILIVGKDWESATELLFLDLESIREKAREVLLLQCLDISDIIKLFNSGEQVRDLGIIEYQKENYLRAIDFFEYTISIYGKVMSQADALMQINADIKLFMIPPFTEDINYNIKMVKKCVEDRNYREFCEYFLTTQRYSSYSSILTISTILVIVIVVVFLLIRYKRRKEREVLERFELIRKRLKDILRKE